MEERTGLLFRTAELLRERKFEFNAWLVLEVGKNYDEAEADIAEAIDFWNSTRARPCVLAKAEPAVQLPGERDFLRYIPLGVGAVISPWNFPNAIWLGMTLAPPRLRQHRHPEAVERFAHHRREVLRSAGRGRHARRAWSTSAPAPAPPSATAWWRIPRRATSPSPARAMSACDIHSRAAQPQPGQIWIKRTVLEMGGKDTIVVDADADLDSAVRRRGRRRLRLPGPEVLGLFARHRATRISTTRSSRS